jgi:hypothetical protein
MLYGLGNNDKKCLCMFNTGKMFKTIFHLQLVESEDVEVTHMEGQTYRLEKDVTILLVLSVRSHA